MKTLANWSIHYTGDEYTAPELRQPFLHGQREKDVEAGTFCNTTPIVGKIDGKVVTRSRSQYTLLEVAPAYEAMFPDAFNRLMNSLNEIIM